jgi:hypothetical protein
MDILIIRNDNELIIKEKTEGHEKELIKEVYKYNGKVRNRII